MRKMEMRSIRVVAPLAYVFPELQPEIGKVYKAEYYPPYGTGTSRNCEFCIIEINGKRIAIRKGEYELVGD